MSTTMTNDKCIPAHTRIHIHTECETDIYSYPIPVLEYITCMYVHDMAEIDVSEWINVSDCNIHTYMTRAGQRTNERTNGTLTHSLPHSPAAPSRLMKNEFNEWMIPKRTYQPHLTAHYDYDQPAPANQYNSILSTYMYIHLNVTAGRIDVGWLIVACVGVMCVNKGIVLNLKDAL